MKALSVTLVATAAAALVLVGAAPAIAAGNAIDPGDSMYVINCDDLYPSFQLLSVESTTAVSTVIGTGEGDIDTCAGQPAYNPSTGVSYYIRWLDEGVAELGIINVATGVSTVVEEFLWDDGAQMLPVEVDAIAIGADGSAFAFDSGDFYSLNLATAELTYLGATDTSIFAFAYDSVTGKFYAIDINGDVSGVNVLNGTLTPLGMLSFATSESDYEFVYSLQFDQAGTAWIESDNQFPGNAGLWSFPLSDLAATVYSGNFTDDPFYTEALLIIPGAPAAMPPTGVDSSQVPLFVGGALLLTLAGAVLLISRRRTA